MRILAEHAHLIREDSDVRAGHVVRVGGIAKAQLQAKHQRRLPRVIKGHDVGALQTQEEQDAPAAVCLRLKTARARSPRASCTLSGSKLLSSEKWQRFTALPGGRVITQVRSYNKRAHEEVFLGHQIGPTNTSRAVGCFVFNSPPVPGKKFGACPELRLAASNATSAKSAARGAQASVVIAVTAWLQRARAYELSSYLTQVSELTRLVTLRALVALLLSTVLAERAFFQARTRFFVVRAWWC